MIFTHATAADIRMESRSILAPWSLTLAFILALMGSLALVWWLLGGELEYSGRLGRYNTGYCRAAATIGGEEES